MRQLERRAQTRRAIVAAAERLFAEQGFDATTIDQIVAAADVARGSFYYNFDSKEQVVLAIARAHFSPQAVLLEQKLARGTSPTKVLQELLMSASRWYSTHRDLAKVLLVSTLQQAPPPAVDQGESKSFRRLAATILERGQLAGEIRDDLPADALAEVIAGVFLQAALVWVHTPRAGQLQRWVRRALKVFLEGAQPRAKL